MTNYFRNGIIGLAALIVVGACNRTPDYVKELIEPSRQKAEAICEGYENNQVAYEADNKFTLTSAHAKSLLEKIGCTTGCISWTCGRNDTFSDFQMYNRRNDSCTCPYETLEEAMKRISPERVADFKKALDATK